jgi:hypothetical protein
LKRKTILVIVLVVVIVLTTILGVEYTGLGKQNGSSGVSSLSSTSMNADQSSDTINTTSTLHLATVPCPPYSQVYPCYATTTG